MSERIREEFERWAKKSHGILMIASVDGFYSNPRVQNDWIVWQDSRFSVSVKNPDWDFDTGYSYADYIMGELHDSGVLMNGFSE